MNLFFFGNYSFHLKNITLWQNKSTHTLVTLQPLCTLSPAAFHSASGEPIPARRCHLWLSANLDSISARHCSVLYPFLLFLNLPILAFFSLTSLVSTISRSLTLNSTFVFLIYNHSCLNFRISFIILSFWTLCPLPWKRPPLR